MARKTSQFVSWLAAPTFSAVTGTSKSWSLNAFIRNPKHVTVSYNLALGYSYPSGWSGNSSGSVFWNGSGTPVARTPLKWVVNATGQLSVTSGEGWVESLVPADPKPATPINFTATAIATDQIVLDWDPGVGGSTITEYYVYRSLTGEPGTYDRIALSQTITDSTFTHTISNSAGQTRWYTVAAVDGSANVSSQAIPKSATLFSTATPGVPLNVTASGISNTVIRLNWIPSMDIPLAVSFKVLRSATIDGEYSEIASGVTDNFYDNTGLSASQTFYYKIVAVAADDTESAPSAIASATTQADPLPAAPTGVTAVAISDSTIRVSWGAVSGATSYNLYQAVALDKPWNLRENTASLTADYTLTNEPTENKTAYFQVSALNAAGEGQRSVTVSATTHFALPSAPAGVGAQGISDSEIRVTWSAGAGGSPISVFRVLRSSTSGGSYSQVGTDLPATQTSYVNGSLDPGALWFYKVRAVDAQNDTVDSVVVSGMTSGALGPATPSITSVVPISDTELQINYADGAGGSEISSHKIYRKDSSGNYPFLANDTVSPYKNGQLQPGTTYSYRVSSVDVNGLESQKSVAVSGTTESSAPPSPVTYFWNDGFENGSISGDEYNSPKYNLQSNGALASFAVVTDPAGGSGKVMRCRVDRRGDYTARMSNYRAECVTVPGPEDPRMREEFWIGWALYFENPWPADTEWCIITQADPRHAGASNPPAFYQIAGGVLTFGLRYAKINPNTGLPGDGSTAQGGYVTAGNWNLGTLGSGVPYGWNHFVARIVWDYDNRTGNGGYRLYLNGTQKLDYQGKTGYRTINPNTGLEVSHGLRYGAYMGHGETIAKKAGAIIRTIYIDKTREAHASDGGSFAAVDPATATGL